MRETNGSCIMGNDVRNLLLADFLLSDFADLEGGLLSVDSVRLESSLHVIQDAEVFIGALDAYNVHLTERITGVSAYFAIDLDEAFLVVHNLTGLFTVQGILETLLQEYIKGNTLTKLMGTWRWSSTIDTLQFTEIPLLGSGHSLYDLSLSFIAL